MNKRIGPTALAGRREKTENMLEKRGKSWICYTFRWDSFSQIVLERQTATFSPRNPSLGWTKNILQRC